MSHHVGFLIEGDFKRILCSVTISFGAEQCGKSFGASRPQCQRAWAEPVLGSEGFVTWGPRPTVCVN